MNNHGDEQDSVDWLDLGPDPDAGREPPDPRRRYLWYAAAAGLVAVALVLAQTQHRADRAATAAASPLRTSTPASPSRAASSSPETSGSFVDPPSPSSVLPAASQGGPPRVTNLGHPLLGVTAGWELFALGPGALVRIQLALGRITTTPVLAPSGDAPSTFVVGSDRVFIRPPNDATGYVVRDGKLPAELPPSLRHAYTMLPGPDQQHLWTNPTVGDTSGLALVNLDGKPTGVTLGTTADAGVMGSDGAGYLLMMSVGGSLYDVRPGRVHRITTGPLLATGPTGWLTVECAEDSLSCADVVIDRAGWTRHTLDTSVQPAESNTGAISPDGKTAALVQQSDGISLSGVQLLDLDSGASRSIEVSLSSTGAGAITPFVWSPDSRWLFTIDAGGQLTVVNRGTGRVTPLSARLPQVTQLGLRHAG